MNVCMQQRDGTESRDRRPRLVSLMLFFVVLVVASQPSYGIPAFARKYGLPCSACHIGWPILNNFGLAFKDNGYQLGNDKDSPIYQNPSYWPMTFRITPNWHLENKNKVAIDGPGTPLTQTEQSITTHGFDLSGLDIWTAGTLSKNISFSVLPSMSEGQTFHLENAWVRFDNLLNSPWLNVKFGKFELDNLLSEKRFLTLSNTGGFWYNYHFTPPGDITEFGGLGANQLGVEVSGHNSNSYSRYSISLLSSVNGNPFLTAAGQAGTARTYDAYVTASQGFPVKGLGVQRIGAYGFFGESPTYFLTSTSGGVTTNVQAKGNRSFSRVGAFGWWFIKALDVETFYMHGQDNVFLGNNVPSNNPGGLPTGAAGPTWNGGFVEAHYTVNPQFIFTGRYELVHMSRQANPSILSKNGNVDSFTLGYRWYPIMLSRAGLAFHNEYSQAKLGNQAPLTQTDLINRSVMIGFDFDY